MKPQLKIALISAADPRDRRTWSGSTFFMGSALERHVGRVDYIGPIPIPRQDFKVNTVGGQAFCKRNLAAVIRATL
jgi:hypothetical protein